MGASSIEAKTSTVKLTKSLIDALVYAGQPLPSGGHSRDVRWDTEIPAFGVRIYPSGHRAFVLSYRHLGRKHLITIGDYGVYTLVQARDRARKFVVDVRDGHDPLARRQREQMGEKVNNLCDLYLKRHAAKKKSGQEDERRINRIIRPRWGTHKVKALTRDEVAHLHRSLSDSSPYEANRLVALLRKMFSLAKVWGMLDETATNPAEKIQLNKEHRRDRWVRPDELPRLVAAIDAEPNLYLRAAFWLYLLTGLRKNELLRAKWTDIDWKAKELRIPTTKSGRVHYVPLSPTALGILKKLPQEEGNPYVLPGMIDGQPLVNISKAWDRVRTAAQVKDVRLHDLRRTVGSWLAQAGNSLHLIGRVLNHSTVATTAVYAHFAQDTVRDALTKHDKAISTVLRNAKDKQVASKAVVTKATARK